MSLNSALGLAGIGVLVNRLFCPSEPEKHKVDNPDYRFCPYCGKTLAKEGEKER